MKTFRLLCIAAVLAISAPAQARFAQLSEEEIAARVDEVVFEAAAQPGAVGLSVAVARGDALIVEYGVGAAELEWNEPAASDAVFRVGALTMQFTAAAIMKLAESSQLALDDPLAKYLPEFDSGGRAVTIRQLLNHTSGVPSYSAVSGFAARYAPLDLTHEELLATIEGAPFDFEPGQGWKVSDTGYYLLGMVVERVTGQDLGAFLGEQFLGPLELANTRYGADEAIILYRAQGYRFDAERRRFTHDPHISMRVLGGAGALSSTAGDLLRWQIALTGGKAIGPASYRQMITSTVPTGEQGDRYGFGLHVIGEGDAARITHAGRINGFSSTLTYIPAERLRVAVISNSEALEAGSVAEQIIAALASELPAAP